MFSINDNQLYYIAKDRFDNWKCSEEYYLCLNELYDDCAYDMFSDIHNPTFIEFMNMENEFREMEIVADINYLIDEEVIMSYWETIKDM